MKTRLPSCLLLFALTPLLAAAACQCGADQCTPACSCVADTAAVETDVDPGHPLRGVVESVLAERQALLVKHEEIPGVMKAMTMMLRVAPFVLNQVKAGDTITATLHRSEDGVWYLDNVAVSANDS